MCARGLPWVINGLSVSHLGMHIKSASQPAAAAKVASLVQRGKELAQFLCDERAAMDLRMGHLPRQYARTLIATVLASGDPSGIDKLPAPAVPGGGICADVLIRRTRALKNDTLIGGTRRWRFGDKPQTSADWASSILLCAVKFDQHAVNSEC